MKRTFSTAVNSNAVNFWLFVARVTIGILMLTHGLPKLQKLMDGNVEFADPFHMGPTVSLTLTVFAEVVCAFLLVLGLATRLATIPLIITMLKRYTRIVMLIHTGLLSTMYRLQAMEIIG